MIKIDKKDKKILSCLDMDARMPVKELAKKVQISREVAEYRLKRLARLGVIYGAYTVFNADAIGYRSFRLLLRLFNLKQEQKQDLISYFEDHPNTWWVASTGGKWDIILNFIAKDSSQFNDIFEEIVARYGEYLQDYEVLIYIDIHDYPRDYIVGDDVKDTKGDGRKIKKEGDKFFFHPMRLKDIKIDDKELQIMSLISDNAQLSYTHIGKQVGLTRNAVKQRILGLEKSELILGYRLGLHPSKLGYSSYMLLLNINNLKKDREKQLLEYAKVNPNVVYVVKHIGKYRITLECEVKDEKKFYELLLDIRDKFDDILIDFEFFPIFLDHKINYFPVERLKS